MSSQIRMIVLLVTLLLVCFINRSTEARPKYLKVFESNYEKEYAGKQFNIKSCTVCHDETNNKQYPSNTYGEALTESLKMKNVTEVEEIRAALKDAEGKPSAIEGKTFGDLIREGRLPASK